MGFASSRTVRKVLLLVTSALVLLGFLYECVDYGQRETALADVLKLFDLNEENNVPALYSAALLLVASVLLGRIAVLQRSNRERLQWVGLAAIFVYLSIDEALEIHEHLKHSRAFLSPEHFLYQDAWVFFGFAGVAAVGLTYAKFVLKLPQRLRDLFLISAGLYVAGALGMEIVGGYWQFVQGKDFVHALLATVEEMLEMLGIVLFISALLQALESFRPQCLAGQQQVKRKRMTHL